jgi:hypothetical protein
MIKATKRFFKSIFKSKPFVGSWYSAKDNKIIIFTDQAYDKFSYLLQYQEITQWRIGAMRRAMLIHLQEKYPGCIVTFDLGVKYRLNRHPVGTVIYWKPEYEKIKGKISA